MKLYRKWEGSPKSFWKDNIYWFTKRKKDLDGIDVENPHIVSYKLDVKLFDLSNLENIKYLHDRIPPKYKNLLEYITGYNRQSNDNWLSGYKNKNKNEIVWCNAPSKGPNTPSSKWEDMRLYKYLLKHDPIIMQYDGIKYTNVPRFIKGVKNDIYFEAAIMF